MADPDGFSVADAVADFHRAFGLAMQRRPAADVDPGLARLDIASIISPHAP